MEFPQKSPEEFRKEIPSRTSNIQFELIEESPEGITEGDLR